MIPNETIRELRRHSSATNLRAQRIEKELEKRVTSAPPPNPEEPKGDK